MPHFRFESQHGGRVAGVDEAGRGPLAGPVVAAAVVFTGRIPRKLARQIDDSKKLDACDREAAYQALRRYEGVEIAVAAASVTEIARLNILHASMLAMARAVHRLRIPPDMALVDGNTKPPLLCLVRCVIGGDAQCLSIAAASIIAKVTRDRAMTRLAQRFPHYGWAENAGYATRHHRAALRDHGACPHHRQAFGTVRQLRLAIA